MSRKCKIAIGVLVALLLVGCVAVPIVGAVLFRGRARQLGWGPGTMDREKIAEAWQIEVELVDDDGDGVPDRGVIESPRAARVGRVGRHGPGRRMGPGGRSFGPFRIIGGLVRLVVLAGVVVLGIVFYRKWRAAHPKTSTASE